MSAMIVTEYSYVFDSVQFGIDLRAERTKRGLRQKVVAQAVGFESDGAYGMIENARYDTSLRMETFLRLCQLFDLHPFDYFDLQLASTLDHFKILG